MALTGYSIPPATAEETIPATATEKAVLDKLASVTKQLSMLDDQYVTTDDIETEDIVKNTER